MSPAASASTWSLFIRLGVRDAVGVGTLPLDALILRAAGYIIRDPVTPFRIGRLYALILCLNIPATEPHDHALALTANADRHAEAMIAFSIDDPAAEHLKEWLARWRLLGWIPDLMETLALRCLSSSAPLRRGLVILRRITETVTDLDKSDVPDGTEELLAIARRPFSMPPVTPRVQEEVLLEHADISWLGYADHVPPTASHPWWVRH
jgi:hypothetical protein